MKAEKSPSPLKETGSALSWPAIWPRLLIVVVVVALDQATKIWAVARLSQEHIAIVDNLFYLELRYNTGAAFSLFDKHPGILTAVSAAVSVMVLVWLIATPRRERITALSLCLVLGGAAGNLIDRFLAGQVTDFIRVHIAPIDWSWPTFNIADSAICVGMAILMVFVFVAGEKPNKA
jgi:signal peptidase II